MNLNNGIWQQQALRLSMTQELSQAIAILQYSAQELTSFVESKALENPLITIKDAPISKFYKRLNTEKDDSYWIERIPDKSYSLQEQLFSQLNLHTFPGIQLMLIKTLIKEIDENGYFRGDIGEISKERNIPRKLVEKSLAVIQGLEPVGIGARNLQECLLIQVKQKFPRDKLVLKIISDYFSLFAERKWVKLSDILGISTEKIQNIFDKIQKLNPKPGLYYSMDQTHFIIPDAVIIVKDNEIFCSLWEAAVPKIKFDSTYFQKFHVSKDHHVKRFIHEKFQEYQMLIRGIEHRRETLIKVIMKICEKQSEYFLKGPSYLNPMTMRYLAQELDVHESTISRAVREKYVQTPTGTVPLKSFFSSAVNTISHRRASSTQIKKEISTIISNEDKKIPCSDQEIAEILEKRENIVISRRTVAKYRDQLGIPSSCTRKRY